MKSTLRWALILGLAVGGCGDDDTNFITGIETLPIGSEACAAGGTLLVSGDDENGDGVLAPDEVTSQNAICADGGTLVSTNPVGAGEGACAFGGTRITLGDDDGTPAGVAGNGELEPEEVDATEYVCNTSAIFTSGSITPPLEPVGVATIDVSGASSASGAGGNGGSLSLSLDSGSGGGHIKIFETGLVDAGFTMPDPTSALGAEPLVVTTSRALPTRNAGDYAGLVVGEHFLEVGQTRIFRWSGSVPVPVTGLDVRAGATLTLAPNASAATLVDVRFAADVRNAGTITTELLTSGFAHASLRIECDAFVGTEGSLIDLAGEPASMSGGAGGSLTIIAQERDFNAYFDVGALLNRGTIDTRGGAGAASGGLGGGVYLEGAMRVLNVGTVYTAGGAASGGSGGGGGSIRLATGIGGVYNAGTLDASGGEGGGSGGNGGAIALVADSGAIRNAAPLVSRGGDALPGCTSGCVGGNGGSVAQSADGGEIRTSGAIDTRGGHGAAGTGGSGGYIALATDEGYGTNAELGAGRIMASGSMLAQGGAGALAGGGGGSIDVEIDADGAPRGQEIVFLGYATIDLHGGTGAGSGGHAGNFYAQNEEGYSDAYGYAPSGGLINHADVDGRGGDAGASGEGGGGGYVSFETAYDYGESGDAAIIHNHGALTLDAGAGGAGGGDGGGVWWWAYNGILNTGAISASGGDATSGNSNGGTGADSGLYMLTDLGSVQNDGAITVLGGRGVGSGAGGDTGAIELIGVTVRNAGTLRTIAGDATGTGAGGSSGIVNLLSRDGTTSNTGTGLASVGGQGNPDGVSRGVFIDGVNVSASF